MPGELNYYHSDLTDIESSGMCHIIKIDKETIFVIKKDELNAISMKGHQIAFYFKTFPSISTRLPYNNKEVIDKFMEFMKKELTKDYLNDI